MCWLGAHIEDTWNWYEPLFWWPHPRKWMLLPYVKSRWDHWWYDPFLAIVPIGQKRCTNKQLQKLLVFYKHILIHLNGFFIIMQKRFHASNKDIEQARTHHDQIYILWVNLKLKFTLKFHIIIDHMISSSKNKIIQHHNNKIKMLQ